MNNLPSEREERAKQIGGFLRGRLSIEEVKRRLHTSYRAVARVRDTQRIPVPDHLTRRSRAELTKAEAKAVAMLWSGATQRAVYAELRVSPNTQTQLRKKYRIPVPRRLPKTQRQEARVDRHGQPGQGLVRDLQQEPRREDQVRVLELGQRHEPAPAYHHCRRVVTSHIR